MNLPKDPNFSHATADANGYVPDFSLLGEQLRHTGNGKIYTIGGFAWDGENDRWMFSVTANLDPSPVRIVRPMEHLTGVKSDGEPRYERLP